MEDSNQFDNERAEAGRDYTQNKGSGDPVQRAAREDRLKQNLRANLHRRKQKARALNGQDVAKAGNSSG